MHQRAGGGVSGARADLKVRLSWSADGLCSVTEKSTWISCERVFWDHAITSRAVEIWPNRMEHFDIDMDVNGKDTCELR